MSYEYWDREAKRHDARKGVGVRRHPLMDQHEQRNELTRTLLRQEAAEAKVVAARCPLTPPWRLGPDKDEPMDLSGDRLRGRRRVPGHGAIAERQQDYGLPGQTTVVAVPLQT